jgi:hypothetical protein
MSNSIITSGRIARLMDARPIACTGKTSLHGPPTRRLKPLGATQELAETVQANGATSLRPRQRRATPNYHSPMYLKKIIGSPSQAESPQALLTVRRWLRFALITLATHTPHPY